MKSVRLSTTAYVLIAAMIVATAILFTGCGNYKSPYDRGYGEGYEAGYSDGSNGKPAAENAGSGSETGQSDGSGQADESKQSGETSQSDASSKDTGGEADNTGNEAGDTAAGETGDTSEGGSAEGEAALSGAESEAESSGAEGNAAEAGVDTAEGGSEGEVLSENAEPAASGEIKSWGGRVIRAEAVNEAMYTNPEVIDGLRQIYQDTQIFGEFVGDTSTNKLHKVGGPHFASMTFDQLVVFDENMSVQDVLNEGFYTECECMH
ncbi:MAG: hypothetical protein K6G03_00635 [Lachnospiraceae bacterium]|nr:hypothetical protein [Lachnospiraceae bacterium]